MKRMALAAIVVAGLAVFASQSSASPAGHWVVTDIDHAAQAAFPDYTGRYLLGLTTGGRVLWTAQKLGGSQYDREVFQWRNGVVSDLGPFPRHMFVLGLNAGGAIVGESEDPPYCGYGSLGCDPGPNHAYLWRPGNATPLGSLGGKSSSARAINDHGQIVGDSQTASGVEHAFLWQDGKMTDISPHGTLRGAATAINDHGQVLEWASFKDHATNYLWQDGKLTDFGRFFVPVAINDRSQVTGWWRKRGWLHRHLGLWQGGTITDLGPNADPYDSTMNARGDVVFDRIAGATHRAVLWHGGKLTDLGDLGGGLTYATAINDRGEVAGVSTLPGSKPQNSQAAAFVWQDGKMAQLPGDTDFFGAVLGIDATGTRVVAGWPLFTCAPKSCADPIVLWTYQR